MQWIKNNLVDNGWYSACYWTSMDEPLEEE